MKKSIIKTLLAGVIVALICLFGVGNETLLTKKDASVVYAADKDDKSKGKKEEKTEVETVADDIDDISVSMDDKGHLSTAFDGKSDTTKTWNTIFNKYKIVITGITGLATLTFIVLFIIQLVKLGSCSDNPVERKKCLSGLLWLGIAMAGAGSATLLCALAWNAIKE